VKETINELITNLSKNPWITFTAFLIAIISFILMIIFYIRGQKKKDLRYFIRSFSLFKNFIQKISNLEILYKEIPINSFSVSRFLFLNRGKDTINKDDIAELDPLEIEIQGTDNILYSSILYH